jgi:nicotinamidase-related amidase
MTVAPAWLVVVDMQEAFRDPLSKWACEGYASIEPVVEKLVTSFGDRVAYTRFVRDPAEPDHWAAYYDRWPTFRIPVEDPAWDLTLEVPAGAPVVTRPTFSKWGPDLERVVGDSPLVMVGVATDCCLLATAYAAADAGRAVTVVSDACAGATAAVHESALALLALLAPLVTVTSADQL